MKFSLLWYKESMKINFPFFSKKDIIVTVHGFGHRTLHEMDRIKAYLEKQNFEVWTYAYFSPEDPEDTVLHAWIERNEDMVRKALSTGRKVHLLGFSMGGVIASYLASVFPVESLLLAAPAFYPIDFSQVERAVKQKVFSSGGKNEQSMSREHTQTFLKVVSNYRNSIFQVDCPVLILHGTSDEVISWHSSERICSLLSASSVRLLYIEGAHHRFLYDGYCERIVFPIIRDYFRGEMTPFA